MPRYTPFGHNSNNIDTDRLDGDIHYLITGDNSNLTPTSIYFRLQLKGKTNYSIYPDCFKELGIDNDYYDFAAWWKMHRSDYDIYPCIERVDIDYERNNVHFTFSRVCLEQLPYDVEAMRAILRLDDFSTSIEIKEVKDWDWKYQVESFDVWVKE